MAETTKYDSVLLSSLDLPYNRVLAELSPVYRLVAGHDTYITFGGKLVKRYGTNLIANTTQTGRLDRCVIVRTLQNPAKIYLVGSFYNGSVWEIRYNRLDGATGWVLPTELRQCNHSTRAHELTVSRGLCYIKGFPSGGSGEKLGSVIFDGTGPLLTIWGVLAPQTPVGVSAPGGWSASAHNVTVKYGWSYVYCYVTKSGHVSSHSLLQSNPDLLPSNTGAFTNKIPSFTVTGQADTTNIPFINVYRTTDGGGTFYFLQQITNTGAGSITVLDNQLHSGGGGAATSDPIPDVNLNTSRIAPTTTSNDPPPTVIAPQVVGTDTPVPCTNMVTYAGRIWYAIGNIIFYSAQEEIIDGVPEEAFPSGLLGNFFRLPYTVLGFIPTSKALLCFTTDYVYQIPGSNKETFTVNPLFGDIGACDGHPRAFGAIGDSAMWVTQDFRLAVTRNGNLQIVSAPLSTDIVDAVVAGGEISLTHWAENEKEFIVVLVNNNATPSLSKAWIYDINKSQFVRTDFWHTPWQISASCLVSGRIQETLPNRRLCFYMWNGTNGQLNMWDSTGATATDDLPGAAGTGYGFSCDTNLFDLPPGNHVNTLSVPQRTPVCESITIERTRFNYDSDPQVYGFTDDFWLNPKQLSGPETAARRKDSIAYKTLVYNLKEAAQRVGFRFSQVSNKERCELQSFFITFNPVSGV